MEGWGGCLEMAKIQSLMVNLQSFGRKFRRRRKKIGVLHRVRIRQRAFRDEKSVRTSEKNRLKKFFACGEHTNITALLFFGGPPGVLTSNYGDFLVLRDDFLGPSGGIDVKLWWFFGPPGRFFGDPPEVLTSNYDVFFLTLRGDFLGDLRGYWRQIMILFFAKDGKRLDKHRRNFAEGEKNLLLRGFWRQIMM